jgi:hypothetical protein
MTYPTPLLEDSSVWTEDHTMLGASVRLRRASQRRSYDNRDRKMPKGNID